MMSPVQNHHTTYPEFLAGGGEMGRLIREFDWSKTAIGPVEKWPQSLRTCIRIMLTSRQPIWIGWGKELIKLYNDPYRAIAGGKHPWALGKPASVVWKDIWTDIEPMLRQVMEKDEGTYAESQLLIMDRNGYAEETYYTFSYTPIPGDNGGTAGMFCANTDDTEHIINERAFTTLGDLGKLTYKEKSIREIYTAAAEVLGKNNKDFPFAFFHEVDEKAMKARPIAWAGDKTAYQIFPELVNLKQPTAATKNICNAILTNEIVLVDNTDRWTYAPMGAWQIPTKQILHIPFKISQKPLSSGVLTVGLNPYRKYDEAFRQFIQLLSDQLLHEISTKYNLDEERKRTEALAELDRVKTTFFSNISHEFRTPLTLMLGPIEDALNDPNTIAGNQVRMDVAHRNGLRLQKLVNTLLDFSRIEANRMQTNFEAVDIASLTIDLASSFRSAVEKAGLRFVVDCKPLANLVYVDVDMWEKIVLNLISNSFKYTIEGSIKVTIREKKEWVELTVSDTGAGIPDDQLERVFERFYRINNTGGRSQEGTGIGLSLVQELVKLHHGTIQVKSKLGKGSMFIVTIPAMQQQQQSNHTLVSAGKKNTGKNAFAVEAGKWGIVATPIVESTSKEKSFTVLVADDNNDMREYITRLLQNEYEVLGAADGSEAFAAALHHQPDLIISDVMMPVLDGYGLLKKIREHPQTRSIPLIFLSALAGEEAKIEGLEAGVDDYLTKPFGTKELSAKVESTIRISKARQSAQNKLYNLFVKAPVSITIMSGKPLRFEMVNDKTLEMWGKSREEVSNKTLQEIFPLLYEQGVEKVMENVLKTGEPVHTDEQPVEVWRDGKRQAGYFNYVIDVLRDDEGKASGIISTGQEVTASVVARKKIEESEGRLNQLANAMPQLVWVADPSGSVTYYNNRVDEFAGAERLADGNWKWNGLVHPDEIKATEQAWASAVENGGVYQTEHRLQMKGGGYRWFLSRGIAHKSEQGLVTKWYGTTTDIHEQKEAEEKAQYLATLTENIADAVIGTDANYRITSWNKGAEYMYGWKRDEVIGKVSRHITQTKFIDDSTGQKWEEEFRLKGSWQGEVVQIKRDGTAMSVLSSVANIKDKKGNNIGVVAVNRDVSERRKTGQALEDMKNQLELTFKNVPADIFLFDKDRKMTFANDRAARFLGYETAAELLAEPDTEVVRKKGAGVSEAFDEKGNPHNLAASPIKKAYDTGQPAECIYSIHYKNGDKIQWRLNTATPLLDDENKVKMVIVSAIDITTQKEAERLIRQSEEKFRTLAETLPQLVWMTDAKGTYEYASHQWESYAGLDPRKESSWAEMLHADDMPGVISAWTNSLQTGEAYRAEMRLKNKAGEYRWHVTDGKPVRNDDGVIVKWIGAFADIHDQKIAAEKLEFLVKQRTAELQRSNEDLQQFAHVASHDLKEPVRKVRTFGSRLEEEFGHLLPERGKLYLDKMQSSAERMFGLIDGVLNYSTMNSLEGAMEMVDLNTIFQNIETDLEIVIQQSNATINKGCLPVVKGSSVLLNQLFYNLINNALKFCRSGVTPVISIGSKTVKGNEIKEILIAEQNKKFLQISICDNGIGFSQEYAVKIFKTFTRLNSRDKFEGTGLGLALCTKIAERHNGYIFATGKEDEGACFYVLLPA